MRFLIFILIFDIAICSCISFAGLSDAGSPPTQCCSYTPGSPMPSRCSSCIMECFRSSGNRYNSPIPLVNNSLDYKQAALQAEILRLDLEAAALQDEMARWKEQEEEDIQEDRKRAMRACDMDDGEPSYFEDELDPDEDERDERRQAQSRVEQENALALQVLHWDQARETAYHALERGRGMLANLKAARTRLMKQRAQARLEGQKVRIQEAMRFEREALRSFKNYCARHGIDWCKYR